MAVRNLESDRLGEEQRSWKEVNEEEIEAEAEEDDEDEDEDQLCRALRCRHWRLLALRASVPR